VARRHSLAPPAGGCGVTRDGLWGPIARASAAPCNAKTHIHTQQTPSSSSQTQSGVVWPLDTTLQTANNVRKQNYLCHFNFGAKLGTPETKLSTYCVLDQKDNYYFFGIANKILVIVLSN
jgi:hypothetical protein